MNGNEFDRRIVDFGRRCPAACLGGIALTRRNRIIASNQARLLPLEQAGDKRAKRISAMLDNINRVNAALLLGYNALHILATVLISTVFVYFFDEAGIFYATAVMTVLIVVFVEIMPKNYALINPERSSLFFWWLISGTDYLLGVVASLIERLSRWMLRLFGLTSSETESLVDPHEEIRGAVNCCTGKAASRSRQGHARRPARP